MPTPTAAPHRIDLTSPACQWTFRAVGGEIPEVRRGKVEHPSPARVPGCVHTDLMAAGLMPDPYLDQNEADCQWPARVDWLYAGRFDVPADALGRERVELAFDGLDTVATVRVNGVEVGSGMDMHVRQRFDVKPHLRPGENEVEVRFDAPLPHAERERDRLGWLPATGNGTNPRLPHNFIRKMSCNFGWDWGPQLVTSGIWRACRLEAYDGGRISAVRPIVEATADGGARLTVHVDGDCGEATVRLVSPTGQLIAEARTSGGTVAVAVPQPEWWFPHTHGRQPLYTLTVAADTDAFSYRLGLRTAELDTSADEVGHRYVIRVNGRDIFVRGANWIPDDCFPSRVTRDRLRRRLEQARAAGINLLRVWGGGTYESDDFYELCTELGILVQQDFLFACALYPEEPPFDALVEAEARDNISRLARHASLVLLNGNNENLWAYFEWPISGGGGQAQPNPQQSWGDLATENNRTWGGGYYFSLLPRLVAELRPDLPYYPGSPFPGSMDLPANCDEHGTRHEWKRRFDEYRHTRPRLMAEYGAQGMANWSTMHRALPGGGLEVGHAALEHRQKAGGGNPQRIDQPLEYYFGRVPGDIHDYHYLTQVVQARQVATGAEWWRSTFPRCRGVIYWQLNDCWPVTSWAAIDGDGRLKPLWYATRRFFADRLLTIQPLDPANPAAGLEAIAHNDTDAEWPLGMAVAYLVETGTGRRAPLSPPTAVGAVAPRSVARQKMALGEVPPGSVLVLEAGGQRTMWFGRPDREAGLPDATFDAGVSRTAGGYDVTVTAATLLRDLCLLVDKLDPDATVNEQLVTILPGESFTFRVQTDATLEEEALTRRPVLMCVNGLTK